MYSGDGAAILVKPYHSAESQHVPGKTGLDFAIQEALTQQQFNGVNTPSDVAAMQPVETYTKAFVDNNLDVCYIQTSMANYLFSLDEYSQPRVLADLAGQTITEEYTVTLTPYTPQTV